MSPPMSRTSPKSFEVGMGKAPEASIEAGWGVPELPRDPRGHEVLGEVGVGSRRLVEVEGAGQVVGPQVAEGHGRQVEGRLTELRDRGVIAHLVLDALPGEGAYDDTGHARPE